VSDVPLLEGARELVQAGAVAGGTRRNMTFVEPWTSTGDGVTDEDRTLLADAQTSGGLLIACPSDRLDGLRKELLARSEAGAEIGVVRAGRPGTIELVSGL